MSDFVDDDRAILAFSLGAGALVPNTPTWTAPPTVSLWIVPPSASSPVKRYALVGVLSDDADDLRAVHHLDEIVDDETPPELFRRLVTTWSKKPRTTPKAVALQRVLDDPRHWADGVAVVTTPTLYEWLGGLPALQRLTAAFYARVPADPLLGPVFAHMSSAHAEHVALFLGEVFGGPATYSAQHGGHANMIRHHLLRGLTQPMRRRWMELLLEAGDDIGLPDDPEFRSAFVGYLEWGTRLAVINSQPGAVVVEDAQMPQWGWGETHGPYIQKP